MLISFFKTKDYCFRLFEFCIDKINHKISFTSNFFFQVTSVVTIDNLNFVNEYILDPRVLVTQTHAEILESALILIFLACSLFFISILGIIFNKRNILILMLCVELLLLSSVLNFIIFSTMLLDPLGQIYAMFIITLAACESAIGLGLLISAYRLKKSVQWPSFSTLKG